MAIGDEFIETKLNRLEKVYKATLKDNKIGGKYVGL